MHRRSGGGCARYRLAWRGGVDEGREGVGAGVRAAGRQCEAHLKVWRCVVSEMQGGDTHQQTTKYTTYDRPRQLTVT